MRTTYTARRKWTLRERGLDFGDAAEVFGRSVLTVPDLRQDDGSNRRFVTFGYLRGRMVVVVVVWTPLGDETRLIISMRKANDREQARVGQRLGKARRDYR